MYKLGGTVGLSAVLGVMSAPLLAATDNKKPADDISVDELSLYTTPQQKFNYVEPEKGRVEESVATLRNMAEPYTTWCQGAYGAVKPKVDGALQFGQDSYSYVKSPPSEFYPRAGIIGFAGVLGLFLARGSRLKKLVYPTGLMTVGTAMYYPQEVATFVKKTGDSVYDWALQAYVATENLMKSKPGPKAPAQKIEQSEEKTSSGETKA
ncbi:apolipoprotein O, a isoform X2 [Brachyhypopomus gauderio]|uniref:apolipoprotein O, a isoform X2 n=1 Tax=Brachyhypopomus gauderio TaxID=698409 RepID=UPI00404175E4